MLPRAARRRLRRGGQGGSGLEGGRGGAPGRAATGRRCPPGVAGRPGADADRRAGQAAGRRRDRGLRVGHLGAVLRRPRDAAAGDPGRRERLRGARPPAARGRGCHHAVELSAHPRLLEDRPGAAGGQHARPQAVALHAAHHAPGGRAAARGVPPGRRQHRERGRRARRRHDVAPGAPQDQLHRLGRDRQEGGAVGRTRPQAGDTRARGQRPGHRPRRRRPRDRRRRHLRRSVQQQRAGVLGHQAGVCPRGPLRRRRRRPGGRSPRHQGGRGHRRGREAGPDQQRASVRAGQGAGGRRPGPRGDGGHRRPGHGTVRATSSNRRS